jgi:hypothetical protein
MDPWEVPAGDYIRVLRPRALLRLVIDYLRLRCEIARSRVRGQATTAAAQQLISGGMVGCVISRDPDGAEFSITFDVPASRGPAARCADAEPR